MTLLTAKQYERDSDERADQLCAQPLRVMVAPGA
jgi:hypothetical protein